MTAAVVAGCTCDYKRSWTSNTHSWMDRQMNGEWYRYVDKDNEVERWKRSTPASDVIGRYCIDKQA